MVRVKFEIYKKVRGKGKGNTGKFRYQWSQPEFSISEILLETVKIKSKEIIKTLGQQL